jgi:hypothetical protein
VVIDMGELDNGSEDMTGLDRVRRQIDRALNRNDPFEAERKKQVELREEVEQLLVQYNLSSMSPEKGQEDNEPSIVDRLIEIKSLLSKQEYAYQEQKRSRELRNRAIGEYIVLGFTWLWGAVTMLIWLRI